ncbi:carbohydrate-binding family 9-like protein [Edaphobacter flagellatus]|uniref:carbohydrate-binding family 9-like protein n=1 Tax=Edaphobacter flagellatus TaxID=1933044 RepID=UPI0021B39C3D|nr:carbohydrate-binding family 9-like protein [Edaphobacter flagellatus]
MLSSDSTIYATRIAQDHPLDLDPRSEQWNRSQPVSFRHDNYGELVPGMDTSVRARWTEKNLYLLFICCYQELHLKPDPQTSHATNELWNWDVAELFIGTDSHSTGRYKEFEISPQAEWLDLDIDLQAPRRIGDPTWTSRFEVAACIDSIAKTWYGAMRIPFAAITAASVAAEMTFRANLFRSQGPQHQLLAWQASMSETFHVPERFGSLHLVE